MTTDEEKQAIRKEYLAVRKERAFEKSPGGWWSYLDPETSERVPVQEQIIPFENPDQFEFTRRWFRNRNQKTWSTFLPRRFDGSKPMRMIQIGVFEGADLCWCLQNILTHPDSVAYAIDPWAPTRKLDAEYMAGVEARARKNLGLFGDKVKIIKGYSDRVLIGMITGKLLKSFDLVVVDGDHTADAVFQDAFWSNEYLKPGGWMLFDDVRNRIDKADHVQDGLDRFKETYDGYTEAWFHRYCDCLVKLP